MTNRPGRPKPVKKIFFALNLAEEFHIELFKGFRTGRNISVHFDDNSTTLQHSDAKTFDTAMGKAAELDADYIVVVAPTTKVWGGEHASKFLCGLGKRKRAIFVENAPDNLEQFQGSATLLKAESESGAAFMAEHVLDYFLDVRHRGRAGTLLVLNGPEDSDPAKSRAAIYHERFLEIKPIEEFATTWSRREAKERVLRHIETPGMNFDAIVCGNDEMALGACDALYAASLRHEERSGQQLQCKVFGYDGIAEAVFAIASAWHPFSATIRIPKSHYGERIRDALSTGNVEGFFSQPCHPVLLDNQALVHEGDARGLEKAIREVTGLSV